MRFNRDLMLDALAALSAGKVRDAQMHFTPGVVHLHGPCKGGAVFSMPCPFEGEELPGGIAVVAQWRRALRELPARRAVTASKAEPFLKFSAAGQVSAVQWKPSGANLPAPLTLIAAGGKLPADGLTDIRARLAVAGIGHVLCSYPLTGGDAQLWAVSRNVIAGWTPDSDSPGRRQEVLLTADSLAVVARQWQGLTSPGHITRTATLPIIAVTSAAGRTARLPDGFADIRSPQTILTGHERAMRTCTTATSNTADGTVTLPAADLLILLTAARRDAAGDATSLTIECADQKLLISGRTAKAPTTGAFAVTGDMTVILAALELAPPREPVTAGVSGTWLALRTPGPDSAGGHTVHAVRVIAR